TCFIGRSVRLQNGGSPYTVYRSITRRSLLAYLLLQLPPDVNRGYRRTGTLWDSRYKSYLIQAETYLLLCQRYIELNPVRAGMVRDPGDYRWSSYRANALGQPQPILTPHPLYLALRSDAHCRETAYRTLFRAPLDQSALDDIRLALTQDRPLGDSRFYAAMPERSESDESRERGGRSRKPESEEGAPEDQNELPL